MLDFCLGFGRLESLYPAMPDDIRQDLMTCGMSPVFGHSSWVFERRTSYAYVILPSYALKA